MMASGRSVAAAQFVVRGELVNRSVMRQGSAIPMVIFVGGAL